MTWRRSAKRLRAAAAALVLTALTAGAGPIAFPTQAADAGTKDGISAPLPRAKPAAPGMVPTSKELQNPLALFEAKIERAFETGDFVALAVAVVKDGQPVLTRSFGRRHAEDGGRVDAWTRFRLASLSKGFAATLAAQLAAEGRLDLQAPVREYAPQFTLARTGAHRPHLDDLLAHRLGLPPFAYDNLLEAGIPVEQIVERLTRLRPLCRVGECFTYQNVAFSLIEPAISRAAGAPFAQALRERVFQPLDMPRASLGMDGLTADANWARPHVERGDEADRRWRPVAPDPAYYRVPSAGGVNASIADMVAWLKAQMGHAPEVLPQDVRTLLHTPRVETRAELRKIHWLRDRVSATHYGLGWRIYDYEGHPVIMHNGGLEGYRAQIAFMPERDLGVVAMWNSQSDRGWAIMPTLFDAWLELKDPDWLRLACVGWHNDPDYCPGS